MTCIEIPRSDTNGGDEDKVAVTSERHKQTQARKEGGEQAERWFVLKNMFPPEKNKELINSRGPSLAEI